MIFLKCNPNKKAPFVCRLYKENVVAKVITDSKIRDQNKYKEWFKDQFSIWDVSQIDLANLVKKFR